ncbi:MAG: YbaK/EbsC family protein [Gammaproteobacteria bacterium]|nr:YbaK/EbsC family protein [Gammaproteobacteria bacterium]|tara:strand:+ start:277 stop:762 length:486 start_codon:yes stop_codon:yes gene_type:complete
MSNLLAKKSVQLVKNYIETLDINVQLIELDSTARTAQDAANSLNQEVGSIVKSLLFRSSENEFYLCLVSGDKYLSTEKVAAITGNKIIKSSADEVKKQTGFSIGGVSPFAHLIPPNRIFIDKNLNRFDMVYAAAGHPYVVFGITYLDLLNTTLAEEKVITE